MSNISTSVRQAILDKLILIGSVTGTGTYQSFFQRVYPESANIRFGNSTLIDQIARHCDVHFGDWGDVAGIFTTVRYLEWTDQQFLRFCKEYVSPIFDRKIWVPEEGEYRYLQRDCVDAINSYLSSCGYELRQVNTIGDKVEYDLFELTGVQGKIHNIVFAAVMKPDILLTDVLNHTVEIPVDENKYLLYDKEIDHRGLTWRMLKEWYAEDHLPFEGGLEERLWQAVNNCSSPIEKQFFSAYLTIVNEYGDEIPALLPQVYLYYDSKVQRDRTIKIFDHQCMDFLMIFSSSQRIVIELDGSQHYSEEPVSISGYQYPVRFASPTKYASMVAAQRDMTLAGYEVYRFGGSEFSPAEQAEIVIKRFFQDLFEKHGLSIF